MGGSYAEDMTGEKCNSVKSLSMCDLSLESGEQKSKHKLIRLANN